ncbi:hypothetical protein BKA93DRAFT_731230 [Sparassis latifolia]
MATERTRSFTKVDLTPRRYHGYAVILFILGTLLPPLAVAARFGIGRDFFINIVLTICGYIPGHIHNFYIQNIRNNKNHQRTPKWVQKYGLVNTSEIKRKERRSQWANRYNELLPNSTLAEQPLEDGQEGGSSIDLAAEENDTRAHHNGGGDFWSRNEERYYGQNGNSDRASVRTGGSGGRWRYPANFDDTIVERPKKSASKKKKKVKKDRWARTEDAYSLQESEPPKRRRTKKKNHSTVGDAESETYSRGSSTEFPEDAEGGLYGSREPAGETSNGRADGDADDIFSHEL